MRTGNFWSVLLLVCFVLPAAAGDDRTKPRGRAAYNGLSGLLHKAVVARLPKIYVDESGWGQTIPIPERMRLGRRRKLVQVDDHLELPHGTWRKLRVWLPDPSRDLQLSVRDLRPLDATTFHLTVEVGAALRGEADINQWQKGLLLADISAAADADIGLLLDCDVAVGLDASRLPPTVKVEPKVTDLKMTLNDFTLRQVTLNRLGLTLEGEKAREVGDQFKGALQELMRAAEPSVKDYANKAIARGLAEGKGGLSVRELLKAGAQALKAKD
jgi:hypothetical protein